MQINISLHGASGYLYLVFFFTSVLGMSFPLGRERHEPGRGSAIVQLGNGPLS